MTNKFDLSDFDIAAKPREVSLKDRKGEPIGLTVTVVAKESVDYQKAIKKIKSKAHAKAAKGKQLTVEERFDSEEQIFVARLGGWKIKEPLKSKVGDLAFNFRNARELFFNTGPFGVAMREQIDAVAGEMDEGFDEE